MCVQKKKIKMEPQQGGQVPGPSLEEEGDGEDVGAGKKNRKRSRAPAGAGKIKEAKQTRKELEKVQAELKKRHEEVRELQEKVAWQQRQLLLSVLEESATRVAKGPVLKTKDLVAWMQKFCWDTTVQDVRIATTKDLQTAENALKEHLLEHYCRVKGPRQPDTFPSRQATATSLCLTEQLSFELARFTLAKGRVEMVVRCFRGFGERAHPDAYLENMRIPYAEPWTLIFPESAAHVRDVHSDDSFPLWDNENLAVTTLMRKDMSHPMAVLCVENEPLTSLDALFEAAKDAGAFPEDNDTAVKRYADYIAFSVAEKQWLFQAFLSQACQFLAATAQLANEQMRDDDDTRFVDGDFIRRAWQGAVTHDGWKTYDASL
jgi:hypothetical protein